MLAAFLRSIEDIDFFLVIFLFPAAWLLFLVAFVVSVIASFKYKQVGVAALLPIGVQIVAILLVLLIPFSNIWLDINFALHKRQREKVVAKVNRGELKPYNIMVIDEYPNVSMGGNAIIVEEHDRKKYVFFYTFRGILDSYEGFLYVPQGGDPRKFEDLSDQQSEIRRWEGHWFYVSHN